MHYFLRRIFLRRIFLRRIFLLCFCHAWLLGAQPVITADVVFGVGDSALVHMGQGFWEPGAAGAGVSWDFSSLTADMSWTWTALDPTGLDHRDSFPSANIAFRFPAEDTATSLSFFRLAADSLFYLGSAADNSGGGGSAFYQLYNRQPELIAAFPFTYGESFSGVSRGVNWATAGGVTIAQTRYTTITRTVDAYGTLTTPFGTFADVVRVKTEEVNYDTTQFIIPVTQQVHYTRYTWYAQGEKYLLLSLDSSAVVAQGLPVSVSYNHMYRMSEVSGGSTHLQDRASLPLRVYPNPSQGPISLAIDWPQAGSATASLYDAQGRQVRQEALGWRAAGPQVYRLDWTGLPAGLYTLSLQGPRAGAVYRLRME